MFHQARLNSMAGLVLLGGIFAGSGGVNLMPEAALDFRLGLLIQSMGWRSAYRRRNRSISGSVGHLGIGNRLPGFEVGAAGGQ